MAFSAGAINGTGPGGRTSTAVDYRLVRRALIAEYRKGRLARHEVCDAHPELRRAAVNFSRPTERPCPICDDETLVLVTYAFGKHLHKGGQPVVSKTDLDRVRRTTDEVRCYVVEVCAGCGWNHLVRTFDVVGSRRS